MELMFCGKWDARAVLVGYKYCPYFRNFVGISFDLILMLKRFQYQEKTHKGAVEGLKSKSLWISGKS